jgi:nitrite reductase/ring-hydroxylating ferredoxin subunit
MNQDTTTRAALIAVDAIEDGGLAEVEGTVDGDSESMIVHRDGGQVRGWFNVCPHAGRRLDWAPGKFLRQDGLLVCAAHGASFELRGGACVAGPCRGESLRAVALEVRDGGVYIADQ